MKNLLSLLAILVTAVSCTTKPAESKLKANDSIGIAKEYYPDGSVKSVIQVKNHMRHGITRNFSRAGKILSEVNYVNNVMEGKATNYYENTGKINSTLNYSNGIKEGDETWFYEDEKPYRVTPYHQGKIEGIQKFFYDSGQPMAEIPYQQGFPGTGLKEYRKDGTLITGYPTIVITREDHLKTANKVLLVISLSNESSNVKFYKGNLLNNQYLDDKIFPMATQNGSTQLGYTIPPGALLNQHVQIVANYKTPMGNPCIVVKPYYLQATNTR